MDEFTFHGMSVPPDIMAEIREYIDYYRPTGSFLKAVITNNLSDAVAHADAKNMENISAIVIYFYNQAPQSCWGSEKAYQDWIASKQGE